MKSRGVYETPGGTLLHAAHRELEQLVRDRRTLRLKDELALRYADLVRSEEHTSELQSHSDLVCRLLLEKKKKKNKKNKCILTENARLIVASVLQQEEAM